MLDAAPVAVPVALHPDARVFHHTVDAQGRVGAWT
jgi:hypothetical protein